MSARPAPQEQPSLPYLIHRIARRLEHRVNDRARADGLKVEGIRTLLRLQAHDHQRVGELAVSTSIEQSALSHMLKRLESDGLIVRGKVVDDDSRSTIVSLTARGRRIAQKYAPVFQDFEEASLDGLSTADRRRLKMLLIGVYERLCAQVEQTDAPHRHP